MIPVWPPSQVERLRVASTIGDRYGNASPSGWTATPIPGATVGPRTSSDESSPGRAAVVTGLALYAPAGTDLAARDRVRFDGETYTLDGDIASWPTVAGVGGIVVNLRRVAG